MSSKLAELRNQIDLIDKTLIDLAKKRMNVIKEVGNYKKQQNIPPLDAKRWDEVMKSRIEQGKKCGLSEKLIKSIFEAIHEEALLIEENIKNAK
jgi:chorismate mutase